MNRLTMLNLYFISSEKEIPRTKLLLCVCVCEAMAIIVVERKSFEVSWSKKGHLDQVRITERGSGYSVSIEFNPSSARWIAEHLHLAGCLPELDRMVKTRDGGDKVLVLQRKKNNRGRYIEISVTPRDGRGRHIIVLEDKTEWRWNGLARTLLADFVIDADPKPHQSYRHSNNQFPNLNGRRRPLVGCLKEIGP